MSSVPCPYPEHAIPSNYTRTMLEKHGVPSEQADVHNIGMIGALFDMLADNKTLSRPDDVYAAAAIERAIKHGVRVSKKAKFLMINQIYGRDFLRENINTTMNAQIGVFCHIAYDPKGILKTQAIDSRTVKQSTLCDIEGIWPKSAQNAGMKWLFNVIGDGYELPTSFINTEHYKLVEQNISIAQQRKMDFLAVKR